MKVLPSIKPFQIRSVHVDGPQPGAIATVETVVWAQRENQWFVTMKARFANGEIWFCPVMAAKDYEQVRVDDQGQVAASPATAGGSKSNKPNKP